jgi:short subunit dehydrogenase-like uncharacterized protein
MKESTMMTYLLYGANGYTAQLIIKESIKKGLKPVLAGRNKEKIEAVALKYGLDFSIFDLENETLLKEKLSSFSLCLNAAGPFSKTAYALAKACIATNTHYLDITGEIAVFEQIKKLDKEAKEKEVMLMPGIGFDVVPSDCLANYLKEKLPDAEQLELSFTSLDGGLSHGTATTMLSELGSKSVSRKDGKLTEVNLAHKTKTVDFGKFTTMVATIPWGDISTAYTSTQIPNIDVFTKIPRNVIGMLKYQWLINPLLKSSIFKKIAQSWVDRNIYGPSESSNRKGKSYLHGVVKNTTSEISARLTCSEGYLLTAQCSVNILQKVLNKHFSSGYQTPAMAYGWKLIMEIPGSELYDV